MKKWTLVDTALTSDGKTVSLHEHDGSYAIRVDGAELMSTRQHGSEEKIAELACAHVREKPGARVLVGGLGFGYTLRAALASLAADSTVVVSEILAAIVAWNRNSSYNLAARALADPRVTLLEQDVCEVIREPGAGFDSIILDVDNGPEALSTSGNAWLYLPTGLRAIYAALQPRGCVAFWSAGPNPRFERLLANAGFTVNKHRQRSHTLFVGRVT